MNQSETTAFQNRPELVAQHSTFQRRSSPKDMPKLSKDTAGFSPKQVMAESERLLGDSKALVHSLLNANEQERLLLGTQLRDEILQVLIGIYIRLIALNDEIARIGKSLNKEFVVTENLIKKSQHIIQLLSTSAGAKNGF